MRTALRVVLETPLVRFDPDTRAYISRVEAADGQPLERGVRQSLDAFVRGCKADGIWDAIKASCIMAGARTLAGALVPLKGTAPTNFNFVSGDYNRKNGLVGDGSTKYLDSGRINNADPQDNRHIAVWQSTIETTSIGGVIGCLGGNNSFISRGSSNATLMAISGGTLNTGVNYATTGLKAASRSVSASFVGRANGASATYASVSGAPTSAALDVFRVTATYPSGARLAFYSIGESLDLALLDARVATLIHNINDALTWGWAMTITIADTTHTLRLNAACTFVVDWGDGTRETLTSTTAWTYTKTYAAPGTYRLRFSIQSGTFYPYYNNVTADAAELRTLEGTGPEAWSFGTSLFLAFYGASGLTEVSEGMNTAGVTNFTNVWRQCSSLTSFPLLDVSSGTNFTASWQSCTSLTSFPANFFDVTGTLVSTAFTDAFLDCALTATSIENILTSLVTNGQSSITLTLSGGTNAGAATWTPAAVAAYYTLLERGWTIALNGPPPPYDTDASAYITAVEAADGQALETATKVAIYTFVVGCKSDGIWDAIKASCIMAGARTLAGALVPLKGTAPTNFNFVSGDYNRKNGLVGDGSTKYLDSGRINNADPQDNRHIAVWQSTIETTSIGGVIGCLGGNNSFISRGSSNATLMAISGGTLNTGVNYATTGLKAASRSVSASFVGRANGASATYASVSGAPTSAALDVFRVTATYPSGARLAFYSIGESLDLALLDSLVTTLINTFASTIP